MVKGSCEIISITHFSDFSDMLIESGEIASESKKGQFLHIDCGGDTFLRRPISICDVDREKGLVRIIFQIRGKGTELLAQKNAGDKLDILGPLGHGFTSPDNGKVLLIGGGIGVFPLLMAARELASRAVVVMGFRNKTFIYSKLIEDFKSTGARVCIATDDGSFGIKGNVVTVFNELISAGNSFASVMTCGPEIMMKSVSETSKKYNIPCQVSLEERMGCGIGTCLCCVKEIKDSEKQSSQHLCVCKDGPVFDSEKVVFK